MEESVESTLAVKVRPEVKPEVQSQDPKAEHMPRWKVLLHDDSVNDMLYVCQTIFMLTPLSEQDAVEKMYEAHKEGVSLLLTTHQERAELYQDQFQSKGLTVTIEPEEDE